MTRNQYILLFIVLAIATIVVLLIINFIEVEEKKTIPFIETCDSFPNDGVYVPAAYYTIQYGNGYNGAAGSMVGTEKKCNENCKHLTSCAGYLYNSGTCYLLSAKDVKEATYYCKHGTGLTVTQNFAEQYRRKMAHPITGYGYFKDNALPKNAIVKAPNALEECLTLRTKTSNNFNTGMAAEKIWTDKSYKIPELEGLDMDNYSQGQKCISYCSSLGGYQHPWCYTYIYRNPDLTINNEKSRWGFCTSGCMGFDCFDGAQTPFIPLSLIDIRTQKPRDQCANCIDTSQAEERCGSCQGCLGPNKTCPEVAPANWSPTQRANNYCLYPGSASKDKCCTETNLCSSIINPPASYNKGIAPVEGAQYRKKKTNMIPNDGSHKIKEIPYAFADPQKLAKVCQLEANCTLQNPSPGNYWCGPPTPSFINNKIVVGIENPNQKTDDEYGKCTLNNHEKLPDTKCCKYQIIDNWAEAGSTTPKIDSYWITTTGPLVPESDISRSCRTQCTNLNPSNPPVPLSNRWCITDPYYPAAKLAGSPIRFPINDPDFNLVSLDKTFWQWGFCDTESCNNKFSWPPGTGGTNNIYPKLTGK